MSQPSSSEVNTRHDWWHIYAGVAFTTIATLLLELALTRIFSVVFYYHFAFLAISIALFGLGVGGVLSYWIGGWRVPFFSMLARLALIDSLTVLLALVFLLTRQGAPGAWTLALVYFTCAIPFVVAGAVLSLVISETIQRIHRVYFFDLLGAAAGCLLLVPLLNHLGGPAAVLAAAIFLAVSSALWFSHSGSTTGRAAAGALALALVALIVVNSKWAILDVRFAKGEKLTAARLVKWNSFSRVALEQDKAGKARIVIDADAATEIADADVSTLTPADRDQLAATGIGFAYRLRPGAKTLIIGAGGGWDVVRALASGSTDVTAVEINPIIANTVMRQRFSSLSRGLYLRPEVRVVVEDGRSFVRRTRESYQVLQATLVDTWASTAAGAFALSENNLYTTDAFEDYLTRLTPDGVLSFTRWGFEPPRESLRVVSLGMAALARLGETSLWRHFIVLRDGSDERLRTTGALDTILIARKPFSDDALLHLRLAVASGRLHALYLPGDQGRNAFSDLLNSSDPRVFWRNYRYDVSPVGDNRPFFFYTAQPQDIWKFLEDTSRLNVDYQINRAVPLLFELTAVSALAVVILLALPPLLLRARLPAKKGVRVSLGYFVFLGAGYILIQVVLVQKFVLLMGNPTFALTVIVFSMLLASSAGSHCSRRVIRRDTHLMLVLAAVFVLVAILAVASGPVIKAAAGWPVWLKLAVVVLLIFPAGFVMGIPFPAGLARLESQHRPSVRWAWSLNAASSVLGSVGAIFLAVNLGLIETLLIGATLYLAALAVVLPRSSAIRLAP